MHVKISCQKQINTPNMPRISDFTLQESWLTPQLISGYASDNIMMNDNKNKL